MNLHPKATGAGIGGALSVIILWGVSFAVEIPPEVAAGFTALVGFACAWLAPWAAKLQPKS